MKRMILFLVPTMCAMDYRAIVKEDKKREQLLREPCGGENDQKPLQEKIVRMGYKVDLLMRIVNEQKKILSEEADPSIAHLREIKQMLQAIQEHQAKTDRFIRGGVGMICALLVTYGIIHQFG